MSRRHFLVSAIGIALMTTVSLAVAEEDHHPQEAGDPAVVDGDSGAQPGQAQSGGMGMMRMMGEGGMMGSGMGMMGSGMGMMGRGMMRHGGSPAVVINIYPGGQMAMGPGSMMGPGKSMMGEGGMRRSGMGMMKPGMGMMRMMGEGGMMDSGMGMMGDAGNADQPDLALSADEVRERVSVQLARLGGGSAAVGEVVEIDEDLVSTEVVDETGAVTARIIVNRHHGAMMRVK